MESSIHEKPTQKIRCLDSVIGTEKFKAGRLCVRNCDSGVVKIEIRLNDRDSEAELLPPHLVRKLRKWLNEIELD